MAITNVTNGAPLKPSASEQATAEREQIKQLAQQFEAMLMTQMLREMRRSMLDEDDEDKGLGGGIMTDTMDIELGQALSRSGGLGLTSALLGAFERQIASLQHPDAARTTGSGRGAANEMAVPVVESRQSRQVAAPALTHDEDVTLGAPISSRFGWRTDPLTGAARFHHGVDIAVAYGHDVKAAASGIVTFAGIQGEYGQTIVVDHDGGRQTRYAHLSEQGVRAGDRVVEGQVIGKSGNSGRTTGPHLHFEMLVDGRAVDPLTRNTQ